MSEDLHIDVEEEDQGPKLGFDIAAVISCVVVVLVVFTHDVQPAAAEEYRSVAPQTNVPSTIAVGSSSRDTLRGSKAGEKSTSSAVKWQTTEFQLEQFELSQFGDVDTSTQH